MTGIDEVTAKELKEELDQGQDPYILDVPQFGEYEISRIEGSHLIPLDQLLNRLHELDSARDIVAYCRTGTRSAQAIEMLQEAGFRKLRILKGRSPGLGRRSRSHDGQVLSVSFHKYDDVC